MIGKHHVYYQVLWHDSYEAWGCCCAEKHCRFSVERMSRGWYLPDLRTWRQVTVQKLVCQGAETRALSKL